MKHRQDQGDFATPVLKHWTCAFCDASLRIFLEVLRRLFAEDGESFRPGLEDFRDETLSQPLTNALASLESAPRPPGWNLGEGGTNGWAFVWGSWDMLGVGLF